MVEKPLSQLESRIGHTFVNRSLITDALTHSSTGSATNYERLEFLGDRVLGLIVSELLFEKFPEEAEGGLAKRLSALVQGQFLAKIAKEIQLGEYVSFSDSERGAGGAENVNILSDVFESLIGALYLDAGFDKCSKLIEELLGNHIYDMAAPPQHPKTALQEWAQSKGLSLPSYEIAGQSGPDHMPVFDVVLRVEGYDELTVQGRSRQEAEKKAARTFLTNIGQDL